MLAKIHPVGFHTCVMLFVKLKFLSRVYRLEKNLYPD